jgi:hypothetical protein
MEATASQRLGKGDEGWKVLTEREQSRRTKKGAIESSVRITGKFGKGERMLKRKKVKASSEVR